MHGYTLVLRDGPCLGKWDTGRAPLALRAVRRLDTNRRQVLADPGEKPHPQELVYLYRRPEHRDGAPRPYLRHRTVYEYLFVGELDHNACLIPATVARDSDLVWWEPMRLQALEHWRRAAPALGTDHGAHVQDTLDIAGAMTSP